ncbi:MAG: methyltransferase domain-containing protein [Myxococcota bacterium]
MNSPIHSLLAFNHRLSRRQDRWARRIWGRRDGNTVWLEDLLPSLLAPKLRVLDVGGGKHPAISIETKERLGLDVTGLDISADELDRAPKGAYDRVLVGDVSQMSLDGEYDLILSTAVLEHVKDVGQTMCVLSRALAPNGRMGHFVPCGRSLFARLNRALDDDVSRSLLFGLFPGARKGQGFPAYYDRCWPGEFRKLADDNGLRIEDVTPFFQSGYLSFFAPAHAVEVGLQVLQMNLPDPEDRCESFVFVARR